MISGNNALPNGVPNYNATTGAGNNNITPNFNTGYNYTAPNTGGDIKGYNPDYSSIFGTQNQNSQNFNNNQYGQVGAFQGAMQSAVNALPTYQQLNQANNQQYNVEPLQQNAANLTNQMLRLPSENFGMTQGSDTNQGQLDQMTGVQQFRLAPLQAAAQNNAQVAQNLSNQATGYGIQNEAFQTSPFTTAAPMIQSTLASAAANFGTQQQAELAALNAKMQSGVTLSTTEMNNLNQLKIAEEGYKNALDVANMTGQYALKNQQLAQQYQPVNAGQTLVNTFTGTGTRAS